MPQRKKNDIAGNNFKAEKGSDDSDDMNATITNDRFDRTLSPLNIMRDPLKTTSDSDAVIVRTLKCQTSADQHRYEYKANKKSSVTTDVMQAIAIESARQAQKTMQKKLRSSKDNLTCPESPSKPAPALPSAPPNASTRSSSDESKDRTNDMEKSRYKTTPHRILSSNYDEGRSRATESRSRPARSRSKTRTERSGSEPKTSDMLVNNAFTGNNRFYGVNNNGEKTKNQITNNEEKSNHPTFHRTLSTPTRSMKFTLPVGGAAQSQRTAGRTKTTGMYNESLKGSNPRSLPPPGHRTHRQVSAQTLQSGRNSIVPMSSVKQLGSLRPTVVITQSGTLPRTPKSRKRLDRSGSTSASLVAAIPARFSDDQIPSNIPSYFHTTKQVIAHDPFNSLRVNEDSRFRRSFSFFWIML